MPSNIAAWVNKPGENIDIREAPYTPPDSNEIVVKASAWAINPVDNAVASQPFFPFLTYPAILGVDIAGDVVEVGNAVTHFKEGDRVFALTSGLLPPISRNSHSGYQDYVVIDPRLAVPIPGSISYAEGTVFPVCLCTAACALFQKDALGLQHPSLAPKSTGKTVLIWGGSSAVGCNAIQLAVAAGYSVIATASPSNFDYLKELGASNVFDYKTDTVIDDIVSAVNKTQLAGIFQAAGSVEACLEVADKANGSIFVATSLPTPEKKPDGVQTRMVYGNTLTDDEVGPAILGEYLPKALANGSYRVAPEPQIVGKGLESLQEAFEVFRKGVSAKKIVVAR